MVTKGIATVILAAALLLPLGCKKQEADQPLIEIAVKVEKQEAKLEEIGGRVQAIEASLRDIRDSLREITPASARPNLTNTQETPLHETEAPSDFDQIAAAISDLQHRLNLVEGSLEGIKPDRVTNAVAGLRDQLQIAEDHHEMGSRLDSLLQEFAWQIDDPARREQFQADIGKLKQTITAPTQHAVEAYNLATSYADEGAGSAAVHSEPLSNSVYGTTLEIAPNLTETTQSTMIIWQAPDTRSRLADLVTKYDIPIDTLKDVGLASTEPSRAKPAPHGTPSLLPKLTTVKRKTI